MQYELRELCSIVAGGLCDKLTAETARDAVRVVRQFSEHAGVAEAYSFMKSILKANDDLLDKSLV